MINASNEEILAEGISLIDKAQVLGIPLRILGAVAIRLHCKEHSRLFDKADRPITDLDVITYGKHRKEIQHLLEEEGYRGDQHINSIYGETRQIYEHPHIGGLELDVFFDRLSFCHVVPFEKRLELDYPTITMTDVFLEKMQIIQINAKDLKDTIIMFLEHGVSAEFEKESIDSGYLGKLMGSDWGYYYTVTQNFEKLIEFMREHPFLTDDQMKTVEHRVGELKDILEQAPKSIKWKIRAKVGTKVKWYTDVDDVGQLF